MENSDNLYKLDDICLILSYLLLGGLIYLYWPAVALLLQDQFDAAGRLLGELFFAQPLLTAVLVFSSILLHLFGRLIRHGEKASLAVIEVVKRQRRVDISQIAGQTAYSEAKVTGLLWQLSQVPGVGLSFDGRTAAILSASARGFGKPTAKAAPAQPETPRQRIPTVPAAFRENPEEFGKPENVSAAAGFTQKLRYGSREAGPEQGAAVSPGMSPADSAYSAGEGGTPGHEGETETKGGFSLGIFIFFLIVFWPIALLYAARYYIKATQRKALEA